MSIADAGYEPSEFEGMMGQALEEAEKRVTIFRKALVRINMLPDKKMKYAEYVLAVQNICIETLEK